MKAKTTKPSAAAKRGKLVQKKAVPATRRPTVSRLPKWSFRLYVAGQTPRSLTAFANLKRLAEEHLPGRYAIEVIDLMKDPARAETDQILALPTLVRKLPVPIKRVIGDLSNLERVMVGIDLQAEPKSE